MVHRREREGRSSPSGDVPWPFAARIGSTATLLVTRNGQHFPRNDATEREPAS
jgi:hypothetical protein